MGKNVLELKKKRVGDKMAKKILLVMKRKMLSDALVEQAKRDSRFDMMAARDYSVAVLTAEFSPPDITIVEIPESGPWSSAEKCLGICDAIRRQFPASKQMILCNENDSASCNAAILAKQENRIDDFVFYDSSIHYLFSKLQALLAT
jgi:hypothetical protein